MHPGLSASFLTFTTEAFAPDYVYCVSGLCDIRSFFCVTKKHRREMIQYVTTVPADQEALVACDEGGGQARHHRDGVRHQGHRDPIR
jgi:hypothetical protein